MSDFITVTGNVTADLELKTTNAGKKYARFTVANTPRRYDEQSRRWVDAGDTVYVDCTAWDSLAQNLWASVRKGTRVIVTGVLRSHSWTDANGGKRSKLELRVEDAGVSVRRAAVVLASAGGGQAGQSQQPPQPGYAQPAQYQQPPQADVWSQPGEF